MKLKICGLKDRENILEVLDCKPDYIGFIFYEKSQRYVESLDPDFVHSISSAKKVGVFVNESEIKILDYVSRFGLDYVQLHGDERPEFCSVIKENVNVIKAFQVSDAFDFSCLEPYVNSCDYFLFDSKSDQYGGSGKLFNHKKLQEYKLNKPYFLSGGIGLDNLKEISNLSSQISLPFAIDVNSKFETSPGIKDIEKLKLIKP